MKGPIWYAETEKWLLKYGTVPLMVILLLIILISGYFLVMVARGKMAIPAAFWATYVIMP